MLAIAMENKIKLKSFFSDMKNTIPNTRPIMAKAMFAIISIFLFISSYSAH